MAGKDTNRKSFQPCGDWVTDEGEPISFDEVIRRNINRFMSLTLGERLKVLTHYLEDQDSKVDKNLAERLRAVAEKIQEMDSHWDAEDVAEEIEGSVGFYIEEMLPRYTRAILYQLMVEGLIASRWVAQPYQEKIRQAAGFDVAITAESEEFLSQLLSRLIDAPRRKRNQVTPGGSESPLKEWAVMLNSHYERLLPMWQDAKKIFKKQGGGRRGREAVHSKYVDFPKSLVDELKLGMRGSETSPEHLAYQHAALLCGFEIGSYSVKQIRRIVSEYKKRLSNL